MQLAMVRNVPAPPPAMPGLHARAASAYLDVDRRHRRADRHADAAVATLPLPAKGLLLKLLKALV